MVIVKNNSRICGLHSNVSFTSCEKQRTQEMLVWLLKDTLVIQNVNNILPFMFLHVQ